MQLKIIDKETIATQSYRKTIIRSRFSGLKRKWLVKNVPSEEVAISSLITYGIFIGLEVINFLPSVNNL